MKYAINNLKVEPQTSVQIIFENVFSLMDLLQLNYEDMEKERIIVENKEGNFRNGKFVIR